MKKPLVISLPVIDGNPWVMGEAPGSRVILMAMQPIQPAGLNADVTHCMVDGILPNGQTHTFAIPLTLFEEASRNPVHFAEVETMRGPLLLKQKPLLRSKARAAAEAGERPSSKPTPG